MESNTSALHHIILPLMVLSECFVQTFKHALKAWRGTAPVQQRLDSFPLTYRNTLHATTQGTPAMLFLGRRLCSRLDCLKPSVAGIVHSSHEAQKLLCQQHTKDRQFVVGSQCWCVTIGGGSRSGHKGL